MKLVLRTLMVVCLLTVVTVAQESHLAGQLTGSFNKDAGYGAPNAGAALSGALRIDRITLVGNVAAERAVKDFQTNGTNIDMRVGARIYPLKFVFGEAGYNQEGQYNKSYVQVGHSYYAGGGLSFNNRFIVGAHYVSNDGTTAQITQARVFGDVFKRVSEHIDFKFSAEGSFKQVNGALTPAERLDPRNFGGQGLKVGIGLALK